MHHIPIITWSKFNNASNKVLPMATPGIPPEDSEADSMIDYTDNNN